MGEGLVYRDIPGLCRAATLAEIVRQTGLEYGIAEIVSYYSFLKEKPKNCQTLEGMQELIPLNAEETRFLNVPYLLFSR